MEILYFTQVLKTFQRKLQLRQFAGKKERIKISLNNVIYFRND